MRIITTNGDSLDVEISEDGVRLGVLDELHGDAVYVPLAPADVIELVRSLRDELARYRNARHFPPVTEPPPPADDRPINFDGWRRELGSHAIEATG